MPPAPAPRNKNKEAFTLTEPLNFGRDVIDAHARSGGDRPALYVVGPDDATTIYSFKQIQALSNQAVAALRAHGVAKGDRVLLVLGKHPAFWPTTIALLKLGAVPMPGTTQLTARDLQYRLEASGARAAIVLTEIANRLPASSADTLTLRLAVGTDPTPLGWHAFDPFALNEPADDDGNPTMADDPALIYFTSGTTGHPKMVLHNHTYPLAHRITAEQWIGLSDQDLHWNLSDTGWAKAAWSSLFGPWNVGAAIVVDSLTGKFRARDMLALLSHHPVTSLCAPPTIYRLLVQEDLSAYNLQSLRLAVGAGEPLNPEVIAAFQRMTGLTIRDGYGQTETVLLVGNGPGAPVKPGSMGRAVAPFTIAVIDDNGVPLTGREGDIAVLTRPERPPGLFQEYVGDPAGTQSRYVGDWYITGDRAIQDDDGYLWFVGRADDVIISAGYRIGPFEVESALIEHPDVVEAAVVSSPDAVRGEVVKAFVVLREGVEGSEELVSALQAHARQTTAPYKYPRKIEFVQELPKTISGKIRRIDLRAREWGSGG